MLNVYMASHGATILHVEFECPSLTTAAVEEMVKKGVEAIQVSPESCLLTLRNLSATQTWEASLSRRTCVSLEKVQNIRYVIRRLHPALNSKLELDTELPHGPQTAVPFTESHFFWVAFGVIEDTSEMIIKDCHLESVSLYRRIKVKRMKSANWKSPKTSTVLLQLGDCFGFLFGDECIEHQFEFRYTLSTL